ncbi:MAG: Dolichyl-phosphate beta-D-mannosyltransferase [Chitinophagaceae bacterium]|nr:Dolichyl-phosphate beta-D-mannosyltransferase [Chitinophagaceae bacterium]
MQSPALVVIPTYNEIENIEALLQRIFALQERFDVLIIDDGSPDGTAGLVKQLQPTYHERLFLVERKGKLGLGTAYIRGFEWGLEKKYDYICEMDADFSHDPDDLVQLYRTCIDKKADLAVGSRYIHGVTVVNWPISRVLMSYFASVYVRTITGMPVQDATAGFKCYSHKVLETIPYKNVQFLGYAFQIEMKFLTWKYGFKIIEVPIIFRDRTKGTSKMSTGIFTEAFWGVMMMKVKSYFKSYH